MRFTYKHYRQLKHGCEVRGDCTVWTGRKTKKGYGKFRYTKDGNRHEVFCHRLAYQFWMDVELKPSQQVRHLCHNKLCVLGEHLFLVENRGVSECKGD